MHAQQKAAWFVLIVVATTLILYFLAVPLLSWSLGRPIAAVASPALGIFGLVGFTGFGRLFYSAPPSQSPIMDERDHFLSARAWSAGMAGFWIVFVALCVGSWAYLRYLRGLNRVTLPVEFFPLMAFAGFIVMMLTQSVATLHFYGWTARDSALQ